MEITWVETSGVFWPGDAFEHLRLEAELVQRFTPYCEVLTALTGTPNFSIQIDIQRRAKTQRTWVFDALNVALFPALWGAFVPELGYVELTAEMLLLDENGKVHLNGFSSITKPVDALFFSWYRHDFVVSGFKEAWHDSLGVLGARLGALKGIGEEAAPDLIPDDPEPAAKVVDLEEKEPYDAEQYLFHRMDKREGGPLLDGVGGQLLRALGAVDASYSVGKAKVVSGVRDENGGYRKVASGRATSRGYRVMLNAIPRASGFNWGPYFGYMEQQIGIKDFDLLVTQNPYGGEIIGEDISGECFWEDTGEAVDCDISNRYELNLRSIPLGLNASYDLVVGWPSFQLFWSVVGGISVLEYREIAVSFAQNRNIGRRGLEFGQASAMSLSMGMVIPDWFFFARVTTDYEWYREFKFKKPIEFMGASTRCDDDKQWCYRERSFVESANLENRIVRFSAGVTF